MREGVLATLQEHGSLAAEQIAALLRADVDGVRSVLSTLRDDGFIDAVALTKFEGQTGVALNYWRLTDAGRHELTRLRASR